mmetsp:Transcript_8633/g.8769  ORF Transcript_8633/g.8769 Transcript_8633/m.8769 type:complete len:187 (+) Transcript_8633:235-795(+)
MYSFLCHCSGVKDFFKTKRSNSLSDLTEMDKDEIIAPTNRLAPVRRHSHQTIVTENSLESEQMKSEFIYNNGYYIGEMKGSFRHGKGIYRYTNGDIYEGEYKDDIKHGFGVYKWKSGAIFEGEYKNDERNGSGIFRYANGDIYEGEYEDDLRHGNGVFTSANGIVYEGQWRDGEMVDSMSYYSKMI